jgi:hypothetical protein
MLSLAHTIISLPFGVIFEHPIAIFFMAFAFHFVLDAVYHWNVSPPQHDKFPIFPVALDIFTGVIVAWIVFGVNVFSLPILAAIAGGNGPDIIHTLWSLKGEPRSKRFPFLTLFFDIHNRIQWETRDITKGLLPQLTTVLIVILSLA